MNRKYSPILWFVLGVLTTTLIGLALYLNNVVSLPDAGAETKYQPAIHISSQADREAVRLELITYLFAAQSFPGILPEITAEGMIVKLQNGFESRITVYPPDKPNGALVIYHTGHEGYTWRDKQAIHILVDAGYLVWRLDMPLSGANPHAVQLTLPEIGEITIRQHKQFAYLDKITTGSPLRYFIEPVIALVNQAEGENYSDIFMVGLSGGGWTTQLAAAVDVRIDAAYPVAAGLPLGLRFDNPSRSWGDWEENLPELQRIASFEDLSILGAAGRSQIQVLNQFDPCCYNDPHYILYESAIQNVVAALGGNYAVYWAKEEFLHRASPAALEVILADMQSQRTP